MSNHNDVTSLRQMLEHSQEAVDLALHSGCETLKSTRVLQLAAVRLVEVLGEAANRVSKETQEKYSSIPWKEIVSMRNRLIHGYDSVDLGILWRTLTEDLPQLVHELRLAIAEEEYLKS